MPRILPSAREAVRRAEHAALDTGRAHIDAALALYDLGRWPAACFLAMTAIEELGKAMLLQHADASGEIPDTRDLRGHDLKALFGTVPGLVLNDEARERHGTNAVTGLPRIDAVRYVAEGGEWMPLRNACLYVDCDPSRRSVAEPGSEIAREHAYLMIVGALEMLARVVSPAFTYRHIPVDADLDYSKERAVIKEIVTFQQRERGKVDLDRLDVIGSPQRVEELRQAVRAACERACQATLANQTPQAAEGQR